MRWRVQVSLILVAVYFLVPSSARAQARTIVVRVPFDFYAGQKSMPAGTYKIEPILTGNGTFDVLRSLNSKSGVILATISEPSAASVPGARLVFHKYGDRYFLVQIYTGPNQYSQLPEVAEEKLAAIQAKRSGIASAAQSVALSGTENRASAR